MSTEMDPKGLSVARRFARWHLGDPYWANMILDAYRNPEEVAIQLDEDQK